MSRSPITCHVLDSTSGKPAQGVQVCLFRLSSTAPPPGGNQTSVEQLATGSTDADGRCTTLLDPSTKLEPGTYRIRFETGAYWDAKGVQTFYPFVEITFNYSNPSEHYHIPLLLSPHSYTTYRGS